MQTYLLNLIPATPFTAYQSSGDLFVYESGSAGLDTAERRIIVKPDSGGEITLRPGQRFRLAPGQMATAWNVRSMDPTVTLTGSIIIGAGEFDDANTLNTFKLDGTFTNSVYVNNTAAQRVPVALDPAVRFPVGLDPNVPLNIQGSTMAYTFAFAQANQVPAGAVLLVAPGVNVNGVLLSRYQFNSQSQAANVYASIIGKASAPVGISDGDVYDYWNTINADKHSDITQGVIKVPAGKGVYLWCNGATFNLYTILYTVL